MIEVTVLIPGIDAQTVLADSEQAGIQYVLYSLGMRFLPEGSTVTTQPSGGSLCSSAT